MTSSDPIWVKIADFGVSKRSTFTDLRTRCGTDGYMAPELLGLLRFKFSKGEEYSFALDMWSLGCLVHELLTSRRPFTEDGDGDTEFMTGVDSLLDTEEQQVNMELLFQYCAGKAAFPTDVLQASKSSVGAIQFVKGLLVADPRARVNAVGALRSPWLKTLEFKSVWFKRLEADFSELGISLDLNLGTRQRKSFMRMIRTIDIAQLLLPSTVENLPVVFEQAIEKGLYHATWMLVHSPVRIANDPSAVQRLFQQAVEGGRLSSVKILLEVGNVDINHTGSDGKTALSASVDDGHCEIVKLLLDNHVDVDCRSGGRTPLQAALHNGNFDIVILENRADIKYGNTGQEALQAAVINGRLGVVNLLLDNSVDVN